MTADLGIPTVPGMGVVWTAVSVAAVVLAGAPWPVVFLPVTLLRLGLRLQLVGFATATVIGSLNGIFQGLAFDQIAVFFLSADQAEPFTHQI